MKLRVEPTGLDRLKDFCHEIEPRAVLDRPSGQITKEGNDRARLNSAQIEAQGKFLEAINVVPMAN